MQAGAAYAILVFVAGFSGLMGMTSVYVTVQLGRVAKHKRGRHMGGALRRVRNWALMWFVALFAAARMAKGSSAGLGLGANIALGLGGVCFLMVAWSMLRGLRADLSHNGVLSRKVDGAALACGSVFGGWALWVMWGILEWVP